MRDARPVGVPAEGRDGDVAVAVGEHAEVDAGADDVQALPEGTRDGLETGAEILRDGGRPHRRLRRPRAVSLRMRGERSALATSVPCAVSAYGTPRRAARRAIVPVGTR